MSDPAPVERARAALLAALAPLGVPDCAAQGLLRLGRPSIRLRPIRPGTSTAALPPAGRSWLGGLPSAAIGAAWPEAEGRVLSHVAQIDLAALPEIGQGAPLPREGFLNFFYETELQIWGHEREPVVWRVTHAPTDGGAVAPPAGCPVFEPLPVTASVEWVLPPWESPEVVALGLSAEAVTGLTTLHHLDPAEADRQHALLGFPNPLQHWNFGEMLDEALGGSGAPGRWRLLLQADSEDPPADRKRWAEMMWALTGRLYFFVTEEDLAARRYDRARVIVQGT